MSVYVARVGVWVCGAVGVVPGGVGGEVERGGGLVRLLGCWRSWEMEKLVRVGVLGSVMCVTLEHGRREQYSLSCFILF